MKVAVISDIHGNDYALARVLEDATKCGVTRLFVLGDFVGYYYRPDRVLSQLQDWQSDSIKGNHECMMERAARDSAYADTVIGKYGHGIQQALNCLSPSQIEYLTHLPSQRQITIGDTKILLCHGSPWQDDEYIYPDAPKAVFDRLANQGFDIICMGHTHHSIARRVNGTLVVNPGSVGQSRQRGGYASWAIIDSIALTAEIRETSYPTTDLLRLVRQRDPNVPYLAKVLTR